VAPYYHGGVNADQQPLPRFEWVEAELSAPVLKVAWTAWTRINIRPDLTSISETFCHFQPPSYRATTKLQSVLAQTSSSPDKTFSGADLDVVTTTRWNAMGGTRRKNGTIKCWQLWSWGRSSPAVLLAAMARGRGARASDRQDIVSTRPILPRQQGRDEVGRSRDGGISRLAYLPSDLCGMIEITMCG